MKRRRQVVVGGGGSSLTLMGTRVSNKDHVKASGGCGDDPSTWDTSEENFTSIHSSAVHIVQYI